MEAEVIDGRPRAVFTSHQGVSLKSTKKKWGDMSKGSLLDRLRGETRPLHDELERAVDIRARLDSYARYADHLTRLWRLHVAAERALCSVDFAPLGFTYPYPYRSTLLEDDLTGLGVTAEGLEQLTIPDPPRLGTVARGLGCMYVVEGSAKGARAILPTIKACLDLDARHGATFFYGYGKETGRLWRACVEGINAIDTHSETGDALVLSAQETFAMFRKGLVAEVLPRVYEAPKHIPPTSWRTRHGHAERT